ncbi:chitin synthesis regulation, resistance to congo red-domain-containing protein [Dendryphion nanum]|uniref:Chitin synthesis regulation, resistance to congo red-domain-containing protein n=1 Tax=Dendryphion nanum TaxID=256645 RepID=A0A9P9DGS7_9PLEO|nr:chitin synthesis regulation, resistance to congo red-domain-containing protein [Dendryphion nanum]
MPALEPRWYDDECWIGNDGRRYCNRSAWNDWVRWVVLAVIVIGFFLLFVLCSCITARRRRKLGRQPYYGTGWASRNNQQHNAQPYYNNQYNQPAPPYSAQPQGGYYSNNNTYGQPQYGQQNGIDLQSPQPAYNQHRGGDDVYSPPSGPPPGKGDGIVR